jgi:hypothetical protein
MNKLRDPADGILVHGIPRGTTQIPELQLDGGHLGGGAVRTPVGGVSHPRPQVDVRERNPGLRLKAAHQPAGRKTAIAFHLLCPLLPHRPRIKNWI